MTLRARKLQVSFSRKQILHGVDFLAEEGELVGILGPSGCGKSTLLRALSGFRPAQEGKVTYKSRDLYSDFEELKHFIGFVPQDDIVPMALKVERALGYAADLRLRALSPTEREGRVNGVIRMLGLADSRKSRIITLSGGQRKRVSVAMELISRPELLFADEPTSGLDPALERELTKSLKTLTEDGRIVVVTTHIMSSLDLLDKVCVLGAGRLAFLGTPKELKGFFEVEDFVEIYSRLQGEGVKKWAEKYKRQRAGAGL